MTKADQLIALLTQQLAVLEQIRNAVVPPEGLTDACPHPEEKRISLRAMGSGEHWQCGDCGFVRQST